MKIKDGNIICIELPNVHKPPENVGIEELSHEDETNQVDNEGN